MKDFRELKVWQRAHALTLAVYAASANFPPLERYGLSSQMRRGAASIATNLAEGCGRGSDRDFARFVQIAMGSASELEYLVLLAKDLDYIPKADEAQLQGGVVEVKRMLAGLLKSLNASANKPISQGRELTADR